MKRFTCYRPAPPESYYAQGAANPPDEPQFEGVVFNDGTVCVRWLTQYRSHSVWSSWADLEAIHGHPEYGTRFEWPDGTLDELKPVSGEDPLREYEDAQDSLERAKRAADRAREACERKGLLS